MEQHEIHDTICQLQDLASKMRLQAAELRNYASKMIGCIDHGEYNYILFSSVQKLIQSIERDTKMFCENFAKLPSWKLIAKQTEKQAEADGKMLSFDSENWKTYSPDAMTILLDRWNQHQRDEQKREKEELRKREVISRFRSLFIEEREENREAYDTLESAKNLSVSEPKDCVDAYELFYQCALEKDTDKVLSVVLSNRDRLESLFGSNFYSTGLDRMLYHHLVKVSSEKQPAPNDRPADGTVPTVADYGKLHSYEQRTPRSAAALISDLRSNPAIGQQTMRFAVNFAVSFPEFTESFACVKGKALGLNDVEQAIRYLYKKGYLMQHVFTADDPQSGTPLKYTMYALTVAGRSILLQTRCTDFFQISSQNARNKGGTFDPMNQTSADFLRFYYCLQMIEKNAERIGMEKQAALSGIYIAANSLSVAASDFPIAAYAEKDLILAVPAFAFRSEKDPFEECVQSITEFLRVVQLRAKLIFFSAGSSPQEDAAEWARQILQKKIPEIQEVFFTTSDFSRLTPINEDETAPRRDRTFEEVFSSYLTDEKAEEHSEETEETAASGMQNGSDTSEHETDTPSAQTAGSETADDREDDTQTASLEAQEEHTAAENPDAASKDEPPAVESGASTMTVPDSDAYSWIADGKLAEGLILLRSEQGLEENGSNYNMYLRFASALGDPMLRYECRLRPGKKDNLDYIFDGSDHPSEYGYLEYLRYCGQLRRFVFDNAISYSLSHCGKCSLPEIINEYGNALMETARKFRESHSPLSLLEIQAVNGEDKEDSEQELRETARSLFDRVANLAGGGGNRVRATRNRLLGGTSPLGKKLSVIWSGDNEAKTELFLLECRALCEEYANPETKIEEEWLRNRKEDKTNRGRSIPADIQNTLGNRISDVTAFLKIWYQTFGESQEAKNKKTEISSYIAESRDLLAKLEKVFETFRYSEDPAAKAAEYCIRRCVEDLQKWFDGEDPGTEDIYSKLNGRELLIRKTADGIYLPYFPNVSDAELELVWGKNIEGSLTDWSGRIKAETDTSIPASKWDHERFLDEVEQRDSWEHFVLEHLNKEAEDRHNVKAALLHLEQDAFDSLCADGSDESGLYPKLLHQMEEYCLDRLKKEKKDEETKILDHDREDEKFSEYEKQIHLIEKFIGNGDFPTARAEKRWIKEDIQSGGKNMNSTGSKKESTGNKEESTGNKEKSQKEMEFEDFWKTCDATAKECKEFTSSSLKMYWENRLRKKFDNTQSIRREIDKLIECWPAAGSDLAGTSELLKKLCPHLEFKNNTDTIRGVAGVGISTGWKSFNVKPKPVQCEDLPPIPQYGTKMKGLNIAVLDAQSRLKTSAPNIAETVASLCGSITNTETPLLVLLNRALSRDEWKSLAAKLKRLTDRQRVLVIDWGIMIHAVLKKGPTDAWTRILRCAAPMHYLNPFPRSSAPIPNELFVGRREAVSRLFSQETPAHFLYGGRQLGKTAVFNHVVADHDDKADVLFVDIMNMGRDEALKRVSERLEDKYSNATQDVRTWKDLCDKIRKNILNRMNRNAQANRKLLLLMDEADAFLDDLDRLRDTVPIQELTSLYNEFKERFRFTFAGKHNVYRFWKGHTNNTNDDWAIKTVPLSVKPFTFSEAEELFNKLHFFGITFDDEMAAKLRVFNEANYFPGLIQLFCHLAMEEVDRRWKEQEVSGPGDLCLSADDVTRIIRTNDFRAMQKSLFKITLNLEANNEDAYNCVAYALADLSLDPQNAGRMAFSGTEIKQHCKQFSRLKKEEIPTYLDELCEMSILEKFDKFDKFDKFGEPQYTFKRWKFRDYLRPDGSVEDDDIRYHFLELEDEH